MLATCWEVLVRTEFKSCWGRISVALLVAYLAMLNLSLACWGLSDQTPTTQWLCLCQMHPMWPPCGVVCIHNVHLRYRDGLPDALNGVSFQTEAGKKIGIVGRTGSGQSSLFLALFRIVQIHIGKISVDEFDITFFPLHDVR